MRAFLAASAAPWAILPEALDLILRIAARDFDEETKRYLLEHCTYPTPQAVAARLSQPLQGTETVGVRNGVAVIPVVGPIFPRADFFTKISGATDIETLALDFNAALASRDVSAVLFEIASPGGQVSGVQEMAEMIHAARDRKPVEAYVADLGASGAYWLASATSRITATRTALLGSIGVATNITDRRGAEEKAGVRRIEIVSSQSPQKRPDVSTDEGRAQVLRVLDDLAEVFVADVARNRATTRDAVLETFGKGDVMIAARAVAVGMADAVGSFESALGALAEHAGSASSGSTPIVVEENMPEETTVAPAITRELLDANHADLVTAIRTEGATAERTRITGILELAVKGQEKVLAACIADPACTVEAAGLKLLKATQSPESRFLDGLEDDEAEAAAVKPSAGDLQVESADKAVAFVMSAGKPRQEAARN